MLNTVLAIGREVAATGIGAVIGYGFGVLQDAARRKHEQLEASGRFKNGWSLLPGSGARVAYLLITLAVIQVICPLLFTDGTQWFVSGGLLAGYGVILFQQLRHRTRSAAR